MIIWILLSLLYRILVRDLLLITDRFHCRTKRHMAMGELNLFKNILFCGVLASSITSLKKKKQLKTFYVWTNHFWNIKWKWRQVFKVTIMNSIFSVNFFFVLLVLYRLFVFNPWPSSCHIRIITETRLRVISEDVWLFKRFRWKSVKRSWPCVGDGSVGSFDLVWLEINHQINPQYVYLNCLKKKKIK